MTQRDPTGAGRSPLSDSTVSAELDPIEQALHVVRQAFASGGAPSLLPHLHTLPIQGVGRWHNALAMRGRPHFENGGDASRGYGGGDSDSFGGAGAGGWGDGYGGFGLGGVGSNAAAGNNPSHGATQSGGGGWSSSAPAGASTGGFGGFGGYGSAASVGGSYGGSNSSYASSHVSSAGSSSDNGGLGSVAGSLGQMGSNSAYGGQMGSSSGGFAGSNQGYSGSGSGFGSFGSVGNYASGSEGFGHFGAQPSGTNVGSSSNSDDSGWGNFGALGAALSDAYQNAHIDPSTAAAFASGLDGVTSFFGAHQAANSPVNGQSALAGQSVSDGMGFDPAPATISAPGLASLTGFGYSPVATSKPDFTGVSGQADSAQFGGLDGQFNGKPTIGFGSFDGSSLNADMGPGANSFSTDPTAPGRTDPLSRVTFGTPVSAVSPGISSIPGGWGLTAQTPSGAFGEGVNVGNALAAGAAGPGLATSGDLATHVAPASFSPSIQAAMASPSMHGDVANGVAGLTQRAPGGDTGPAMGVAGLGYDAGQAAAQHALSIAAGLNAAAPRAAATATPDALSGLGNYKTLSVHPTTTAGSIAGLSAGMLSDSGAVANSNPGLGLAGGYAGMADPSSVAAAAPGSLSTDPSVVGNLPALTVHAPVAAAADQQVSLAPAVDAFNALAAGQMDAYNTQHADLALKTQAALSALDGPTAGMAASVFGVGADQMKSFMNDPMGNQDVGSQMLGALDHLKAEAVNGDLSGFGALSHPVDSQAVQHMMSEGGFTDPAQAVDAVKGFISSKMNDVAPHFAIGPAPSFSVAAGAPSTSTVQGPATGAEIAGSAAGFGPYTGAFGDIGAYASADPSTVAGLHALTVHAPTEATGFDGEALGSTISAAGYAGNIPSLAGRFSSIEGKYGLSPGYLSNVAQIESRGDPNAVSPTGARGEFQFTRGTANEYGLADRNDPEEAADAAARLTVANNKQLAAALSRDPTPAESYLAHQQGLAGAIGLLSNPGALATSVVGDQAVVANGGTRDMTAGQFADMVMSKYDAVAQSGTAATPSNDRDSSPDDGVAAALSMLQDHYGLASVGAIDTFQVDAGDALQKALAGIPGLTIGSLPRSGLPSFAAMDALRTSYGDLGLPATADAVMAPIASAGPVTVHGRPAAAHPDADLERGTFGGSKLANTVLNSIPVLGFGRSVMTLLGGTPAGVNSPAMTHAEGGHESGNELNDWPLPSYGGAGSGGNEAPAAVVGQSDFDAAQASLNALLAQLAHGNSASVLEPYNPSSSLSASRPQAAPFAWYNPESDLVVQNALRIANGLT